jgi:ABC-type antimicrobial peptide transport system permease subunit
VQFRFVLLIFVCLFGLVLLLPYSTDKKKIIKKAYPYTSWEPEQFHPLLGGKGVGCRVKNIVGGSNINLSASYIGI